MSDLLAALAPEVWQRVLGNAEPGGSMTRAALADFCPKCQAHRIIGLDDDRCALPGKVDAEPVSAIGEVYAHLASLRTFELRRFGGRFQLDRRLSTYIARRPAGAGLVDVMAEHRCGQVLDRATPVLRMFTAGPSEPDF